MKEDLSLPPRDPQNVLKIDELTECLRNLIGREFNITGKPRTDGANIRKMVSECLIEYGVNEGAKENEFNIIPPRGKGIPRILREMIDTYIVTSGNNYNLQVWNRFPNSKSVLVEYTSGKKICSSDIRLVFIKIDMQKSVIESVIILTPQYIEEKFGLFGKPTIKHQLIISDKKRESIIGGVLLGKDTNKIIKFCRNTFATPIEKMTDFPLNSKPFSIELINELVAQRLIGVKLESADTKTKGQMLERVVLSIFGYDECLSGSYPDIPNQLLEVKVQDSPTIDLGKYSPETEDVIYADITTKDIRYLIALTNPNTNIIEGVVLMSGYELGSLFTFVGDISFKCQRSIPMSFFEKYRDMSVSNP